MNLYQYCMFEKEITNNRMVSNHFIYDYFDTVSPENSKLYILEKQLKESVTLAGMDTRGFAIAITPGNTTSPNEDMFHIGSHIKKIDDNVMDFFKLKANFEVLYFSKKVKNATQESDFKCGYTPETFFNQLNFSKWKSETENFLEAFQENAHHIIVASHFNPDGSNNEKELNLEIVPEYSLDNYQWLKTKLLAMYDIREGMFDLYDKKFVNYTPEKFHFHVKVKYTDAGVAVKFYRTWPYNPYYQTTAI